MGASTITAVIVLATQRSVFKFRFVDIDFMSVLHMVFFPQVLLSAPSTATTPTAAASAEASTHAGRTATATCPRTRAAVPLGTPSEGVPVSAAASRQIPATYTVRPSPTCTKPTASPIAEATIAAPVAGEIAALSSDLLPGVSLAIRHRVSTCRTAEPVCCASVPLRGAAAMLWIVLPAGRSAEVAASDVVAVPAVDIVSIAAVDVRVTVEVIVVINVDLVVSPACAPTPASSPRSSHSDAEAKGNRHASGVVSRRRIVNGWVRIDRRAIHHHGIIRRHIDNLWVGLFNHDHALAFYNLGLHFLLLARFQIAGVLRLLAHA